MSKTPETCPHCEAWLHRLVENDRYSFACGTRRLETTITRAPDCYERELATLTQHYDTALEQFKSLTKAHDECMSQLTAEREHADMLAQALKKMPCPPIYLENGKVDKGNAYKCQFSANETGRGWGGYCPFHNVLTAHEARRNDQTEARP